MYAICLAFYNLYVILEEYTDQQQQVIASRCFIYMIRVSSTRNELFTSILFNINGKLHFLKIVVYLNQDALFNIVQCSVKCRRYNSRFARACPFRLRNGIASVCLFVIAISTSSLQIGSSPPSFILTLRSTVVDAAARWQITIT